MSISMIQALRNAVEIERAGARFYEKLAEMSGTSEGKAFFSQLASDEVGHAKLLEAKGEELGEGYQQALPEAAVKTLESAPGWEFSEDLSMARAVEIALEAETQAALYYDAMADFAEGEAQAFLKQLADIEQAHVERLNKWQQEHAK